MAEQPSSEPQETSPQAQDQDSPSPESSPEVSPESQEAAPEGQEGQEESPAEEPKPEDEEGEEEEPKPEQDAKPPEGAHKRTGGYQRKIERLERERQILLEQLAKSQGQAPQTTPQQAAKAATPEQQAAQQLEGMFNQWAAQRDAQRAEEAKRAEFQKRMEATRAAHPDFEEAVEMVSHIHVPDSLKATLLTSEGGPEIMYQLAKSPAELARISALPPLDGAREIGRLEAKLASGATPQKPKQSTRPPAPPSKVGGSTTSTRNLEDLPISEYKRALRSGRR